MQPLLLPLPLLPTPLLPLFGTALPCILPLEMHPAPLQLWRRLWRRRHGRCLLVVPLIRCCWWFC